MNDPYRSTRNLEDLNSIKVLIFAAENTKFVFMRSKKFFFYF